MSTAKFESDITRIPAPINQVYNTISDLTCIGRLREMIPAGNNNMPQIKEMRFDTDTCTITADTIGEITFRIIEREEPKMVKFTAENSPIPLFLWVQLLPLDEQSTKTRVTIKAEINALLKPMISKPLQEAVNRIAQVLTIIPYNL